jgi:isopentenyl diphosphate isomerase/L-lactate dehydrogenase-like FMN-dependent dehydrogenase
MTNDVNDFQTLHEFVKVAKMRLAPNAWDYLVGGTETETTLRRNRLAIDSLGFRPRVLRDVSHVDPTTELFGHKVRLPIVLAPVGSVETFEEGGGASVAKAAGEFGIWMMLSSVCNPGPAAVGKAGTGPKIFQLYVRGDSGFVDDHVKKAIDSGFEVFCITVDTAHYSRRERDIAKRYVKSWRTAATGHNWQAALNWDDIARFKAVHKIPLILKGIATAEDAKKACEIGVEGIYVSNHGGRQLDQGRGSLEVLPEVVDAVKGRAKVIVDGSFLRGTDIIKAMASGADAVGVGRLYLYGLAARGPWGMIRLFEILENEIITAMGLLGVSSWKELDRSYLQAAPVVTQPHALSAFPLLAEGY